MKAVILAGGFGTRIAEETQTRPKPMVEIGGRPILWHIMKTYSTWGISEFIVCLGYRGYVIKEYFANYFLHMSDVTFNMLDNSMAIHQHNVEPWKVTLVDTGEATMTGGRLRRVIPYLEDQQNFCFTYGDGLTNANIASEIELHQSHGRAATVLAVRAPGRYGALDIENERVASFVEKPVGDGAFINGGYFVVARRVLDLLVGDETSWENDVLPVLAAEGELVPFVHEGFWQPMDTLREKNELEAMWVMERAPWRIWQ